MKTPIQLDDLNLDTAAKTQVVALVQSLLEQAETESAKYYEADIHAKDLKIQALILELAHLRRIRYGVKNEALSSLQRDLFQEACNEDIAALEAEVEQSGTTVTKPKRPRAGRQPLPPHLPRTDHLHEPESCQCGRCGKDLIKIGEDITEQLDVEPAKFFVHRHIRPQYACRPCETITTAPIPPAIIDGGMAAVGLLTWVMVSKYLDHLPLYRLEQIAARDNVILARSTLAEWVGRTGVALQPLADRLSEILLEHGAIHADETPVPQLDPTKRAYLWAYRSNDLESGPRIIVFDYRGGRSGEHARQFLGTWQGHLLVDDYGGYKALFSAACQEASPCIELGCWAHARRKFFDLHKANASSMALEALTRIGQLYAIEQQGKALDIDARQQLRAEQSRPILDALHQ